MFKNLVTLVTGGASGFGKATAERFIKKGSKIVLCDLKTSNGEAVAKELGDNAIFIPVDVTSPDDVQEALNVTKETYKKLDVLVNCSSISCHEPIYNINSRLPHNLSDFEKVLNVNLKGTFNTIRLAIEMMSQNEENEEGERGVIINTAGIDAYDAIVGQTATAAASGGIVSMTLPLARELADKGIRVVTIAPGLFDIPPVRGFTNRTLEFLLENEIPHPKCLGHPDDFAMLAQAIVTNPYINGTTIRIDGALRLTH